MPINEVIVIDSSDQKTCVESNFGADVRFEHIQVTIKSAAIQRNLGMDLVSDKCDFLCFLDDDVLPDSSYISRLVSGLIQSQGIGISGLALNPKKVNSIRREPVGFFGLVQRLFFLDSKRDGVLLKSGVNIPIRNYSGEITKVEWLIGCALWDFKKVSKIRFESDFLGQSLNEDVIFSIRAAEHGNLFVNPRIHLSHTESIIGRPINEDFWKMWVLNRRRLVRIFYQGKPNFIYYHIANFGQFISLVYAGFRNMDFKNRAPLGILLAYKVLIQKWKINEN